MDILPRPIVEAKLKIPGEKKVLVDVVTGREYRVAAPI
jgi:hypothetical protein